MLRKIKNLIPQRIKNVKHWLWGHICHLYYGQPANKLKIIGITGTNGKTTTASLLYEILFTAGFKIGYISTIKAKIGDEELDTGFHVTSPDQKPFHQTLRKMVEAGLEYVVLEVTSHGLDQHRIAGVKFDYAVYTNITHEHLDYHQSYEKYFSAKARLLSKLLPHGIAILNKDDESYNRLNSIAQNCAEKVYTYSIKDKTADHWADKINIKSNHTTFSVQDQDKNTLPIILKMPGEYNVSNALAAITVANDLQISPESIQKALRNIDQLAGRWEIMLDTPFKVIVDFAHTPDALERVLSLGRKQLGKSGKLISVFGCAGLRDYDKRPIMGEISGRLADITILTAEDPRTEDIEKINLQIEEGLWQHDKSENKDYFKVNDRYQAINKAIDLAKPGDIIIIAGKGHEKSLNLDGKKEIHWSDQEAVKKILAAQNISYQNNKHE